MYQASMINDAIGVDTKFSADGGGRSETELMGWLCSSGAYGKFECVHHIRDGEYAGSDVYTHLFNNADADLNLIAIRYGVGAIIPVESYMNTLEIGTANKARIGVDAAISANEPDAENFSTVLKVAVTTTNVLATPVPIVQYNERYPLYAGHVIIGEGANAEEAYIGTGSNPNPYTFATGQQLLQFSADAAGVNAHKWVNPHSVAGGILSADMSAPTPPPPTPTPTPTVYLPPLPPGPGTPVPTPLPAFPHPARTPIAVSTSWVVTQESSTNFTANQPVTLNCNSTNAGRNANTEVITIDSVTGSGLNNPVTLKLHTTPIFDHKAGEVIAQGCVSRVPDNVWGAWNDVAQETVRIHNAINGTWPVCNPSRAGPSNAGAFWPGYGGIPLTYSSFECGQVHYVTGAGAGNPGGAWGDGTDGWGGSHNTCLLQVCVYGSFQGTYSTDLEQTGSEKPIWCTECSYGIVPQKASNSSIYYSGLQIPEEQGVVYTERQIFYPLKNGNCGRIYWGSFYNGDSFCTDGLIYLHGLCNDTMQRTYYDNAGGSSTGATDAPKAAYNTEFDLLGLFDDPTCDIRSCKLTTDNITYAWGNLPPVDHLNYGPSGTCSSATGYGKNEHCGTDPDQVKSMWFEYGNGDVIGAVWYEGNDYLQSLNDANTYPCVSKTSCDTWCSNYSNNLAGGNVACFHTSLTLVGAHAWGAKRDGTCSVLDTDATATHSKTFGHIIPTSTISFNATTDRASIALGPEIKFILCTNTNLTPGKSGTAVPTSPTPQAMPIMTATPDATPTPWPKITPVPTAFQ